MSARLTVFMPVYNAEATLGEALASILGQSFGDFELLVVDDGSRDGSSRILGEHARRDRRVRVLRNARNQGLASVLSQGFAEARDAFVARMDADDISEPRRLERQLAWLQRHPGTAVLGSWARFFGDKTGLMRLPWRHEEILAQAPFQNPLAHPTLMLARDRFPWPPHFERRYQPADDYGLWSRCLQKGLRFAALPEPLLRYRVHAGQAGASPTMRRGAERVRLDWLRHFKVTVSVKERALHLALAGGNWAAVAEGAEAWLRKLRSAGDAAGMPGREWGRWLGQVWLSLQAARPSLRPAPELAGWSREGGPGWRLVRAGREAWQRLAARVSA